MDTRGDLESDQTQKKKKLTWYKADIEPGVGTALFFEIPVSDKQADNPLKRVDSKPAVQLKRQISKGKTLVLNPASEHTLKKHRSRIMDDVDQD